MRKKRSEGKEEDSFILYIPLETEIEKEKEKKTVVLIVYME